MEIQPDIRRRLGPHDVSIDLPMAGAIRCGFTHLHAAGCIDYPPRRQRASASC